MDDDTLQMVRQICTEIGCIMEDTSLTPLVWGEGDGLSIQQRIDILKAADVKIGDLVKLADRSVR